MGTIASQITILTIVYSTVYSGTDERRKHQRSASLAFVWGIHRWPVNLPLSDTENVSIWWRHHEKNTISVHIHWDILRVDLRQEEAQRVTQPTEADVNGVRYGQRGAT